MRRYIFLCFVFFVCLAVSSLAEGQTKDADYPVWWLNIKDEVIPRAIKMADEESLRYVSTVISNWKERIPRDLRERDKEIFVRTMKLVARTKALNNRLTKVIEGVRNYFKTREKTLPPEETKHDGYRLSLTLGLVLYTLGEGENGLVTSYKEINTELKNLIAIYKIDYESAKRYERDNPVDFGPIVNRFDELIKKMEKASVSLDGAIAAHETARNKFMEQMLTFQRLVILSGPLQMEIIEEVARLAEEARAIASQLAEMN